MSRPLYVFVVLTVELVIVASLLYLIGRTRPLHIVQLSSGAPQSTTSRPPMNGNHVIEETRRSYLMALGYVEQLTSATRSFLQLFPLASDWNMHVPEPFVMKSRIFGIFDLVPPAETIAKMQPMSQLYNLSVLNNFIHEQISPDTGVVPIFDFIKTASRNVIIFHYGKPPPPFSEFGGEWVSNSLARRVREAKVTDCGAEAFESGFAATLERHLNMLAQYVVPGDPYKFCVTQALCFDHTKVHTSTHLLSYLSLPSTVVFTNWRGCSFANCSLHYQDNRNRAGQQMPPHAIRTAILTNSSIKVALLGATMAQFHHPVFLKQAKHYLSKLKIDGPFLAIHIRSERIVRDAMKLQQGLQYPQQCLWLLEALAHRLAELFGLNQTIVITDSSSSGSDSCQFEGTRCKHSHWNSFISALNSSYLMKHHVVYHEEGELGTHTGYISLVECSLLSLGTKLVLVGHGAFQNMVEGAFIKLGHVTSDVYHICDTVP